MLLPTIKYPLDKTGTSTNNLVLGERHILNSDYTRTFCTKYGPFYSAGLKVREMPSGRLLQPVIDYVLLNLEQNATILTGKEVMTVIAITNQLVTSEVHLDYQVVGGDYSLSVSAIQDLLDTLQLDQRPVFWGDLVGVPSEFPPSAHLHDAGDLYGLEYVVAALENIRNAVLEGDVASHHEIIVYIDTEISKLKLTIGGFTADLAAHIENRSNPHQTNKSHVGLSLLQNFGVATKLEAEAGLVENKYTTPLRVKEAIIKLALDPLVAHIGNTANPHGTTKTHVQLGLVENYGVADFTAATAGTRNDLYMTPLRVNQSAVVVAQLHMQNHLALVNPHGITKATIGLSNVLNYGKSSVESAVAGDNDASYMTPLLVKAAIEAQARQPLFNHINDYANPHQTNKSHVGLSNIPNAITSSRSTNSDAQLLTAAGMFGHVGSGDHDARYKPYGLALEGSLTTYLGAGFMYISGAWRQFWPAQWS